MSIVPKSMLRSDRGPGCILVASQKYIERSVAFLYEMLSEKNCNLFVIDGYKFRFHKNLKNNITALKKLNTF